MRRRPTPGQVCYEAFCLFWCRYGLGERALVPWSTLTPEMHAAWEAAAQAVLAPRLTDQAAQLHHLIDYVVEHAPQAYLDKVHIWLTDLSGIVHQEYHAPSPEEDEGA